MADIQRRYMVMPAVLFEGCFNVHDSKEHRVICICQIRKDADMIAGTLNKAWDIIAIVDELEEMGG